ncbi:MAG: endonuclease/exonuclease/phosphatase family protein [Pyrinomonadaceae bacterium]
MNFSVIKRVTILLAFVALTVSATFAQKDYPISAIQGPSDLSPRERDQVRVTGVVTARVRNGFFVQTPDDKVDSDPMTSEGVFVFTTTEPGGDAAIGNMVSVSGIVDEFRPRAEPKSLPITQVKMQKDRDRIEVISKNNELPKPIILSAADFAANKIYQLEKYENMRVTAPELTVVAPTDARVDNKNNTTVSNGVFYGILKGQEKPFREPGYNMYDFLFLSEKEKAQLKKQVPKLALFDANPQRLRIESAAQLGAQAINVPAHLELKNVTGVMYYGYQCYSILVDVSVRPSVSGGYPKQINMPPVGERQFSVATMNLENLFDDIDDPEIKEDIVTTESFNARLKKISIAVRTVMQSPDVIGVTEAENLSALKRLADKINTDTEQSGKPNPKYEAYVEKGNDGRGINVGFLVKSSRVKTIEVKQFGKDDKFKDPNSGEADILNDRTPLMLRASIEDAKIGQPFEFTVVVNHLKSFLGSEDPKRQDGVRLKKKLQAELLAKFVQERQKADPKAKVILVGDFNAYQFNDGVVDVIGTIKGKSAAKDEVLNPSDDLVEPDMINLVDLIAAGERYSYRYDGNGQVLDHVLVTQSLMNYIRGFGYARVNADFPESFRSDDTRAERFSDHDPAVAYFSLDPKPSAAP